MGEEAKPLHLRAVYLLLHRISLHGLSRHCAALLAAGVLLPVSADALTWLEAADAAAAYHEDADAAAIDVLLAEASAREARAALLPTLSAGGQLVRNDRAVELGGGGTFTNLWDWSANATLSLRLLDPATIPALRAARERVDVAELGADATAARLRAAAAIAFLDALVARDVADRTAGAVARREASLTAVAARTDAGYGVANDVELAQLALERAVLDAELAQLALIDALDALARLTGLDEVDPAQLVAPSTEASAGPPATSAQETASPASLLSLRASVDAAARDVRAARLDLLPVLTLDGRYSFGRETLRAPNGRSWTITLGLTWTLFDDARYARIDAAELREQRAAIERDAATRDLARDGDALLRRLDGARREADIAARSVAVTERTRALVETRYGLGDATVLDLIAADDDVDAAVRTRVAADIAVERAQIELLALRGALDGAETGRPE